MFGGKSTRVGVILFCVWVFPDHAAFAQDVDAETARIQAQREAAQRQAEERRAAEQQKQDRERGIKALNDFLIDTRTQIAAAVNSSQVQRERERALQEKRYRIAFEEFESARQDLGAALGFKTKLRDPGKKIAKNTAVLLDFVRRMSKARPTLNLSEFKDFTQSELGWEALTTAERVSPHVSALFVTNSQFTVDVGFLKSLVPLQAELLRLQWMAQRLK